MGQGFPNVSNLSPLFQTARTQFLSVAHVLELVAGYCCCLNLLDHCKQSNVIITVLNWATLGDINGMAFSRRTVFSTLW